MPPKKHAKHHHHPEHEAAKHLRRSYEHLGRVEALGDLAGDTTSGSASQLLQLARKLLNADSPRDAADALRAAEHVCFATLASNAKAVAKIDEELLSALDDEFDKLAARAEEHWESREDRDPVVMNLFPKLLQDSRVAYDKRKYRQALELVRAAEALAHVDALVDSRHRLST